MPTPITSSADIAPGDFYEDCAYHPCLCLRVLDDEVSGVSLVDESYPRSCGIGFCGVRKLTFEEAMHQKFYGPMDVEVEEQHRWWHERDPAAWTYWPYQGK
jgi:hypothetical protein